MIDKTAFALFGNVPAPQVEYDLRYGTEHFEKLKFNWVELHSKKMFLSKLGDGEEWRACGINRWTPGELKQLENSVEPSKMRLKTAKGETIDLQRRLQRACETICQVQETVAAKHQHARELLKEYVTEGQFLDELRQRLPAGTVRSLDELQTTLDEQSILLEKRAAAVERQRNAIADLERLLTVHESDNAKLEGTLSELEERRKVAMRKEGAADVALERLCQWHSAMLGMLEKMTGCRVEMVRLEYLLVQVQAGGTGSSNNNSVPVHIYVDGMTGRLRNAKVGSTSNTPKRQWREIIEAAIEYNDIPFLIRSIASAVQTSLVSLVA